MHTVAGHVLQPHHFLIKYCIPLPEFQRNSIHAKEACGVRVVPLPWHLCHAWSWVFDPIHVATASL